MSFRDLMVNLHLFDICSLYLDLCLSIFHQADILHLLYSFDADDGTSIVGSESPALPLFVACQLNAKSCFLYILQRHLEDISSDLVNAEDDKGSFLLFGQRPQGADVL